MHHKGNMNIKKVICLPHAGGMAMSYKCFERYADKDIQFIIVELSGHGGRCGEGLYNTFEEAVDDIYKQIKDVIREEEYIIFGHSMGSWLAFELYYKIKREKNTMPMHMFFSGNVSPFYEKDRIKSSDLSDEVFLENIVREGLTSREIFEDSKLREIFLPVLKHDFQMLEDYYPEASRELIHCEITVMGGYQDISMGNKIESWRSLTSKKCKVYYFKGDHFFLFSNAQEVVKIIAHVA